MDGSGRALQTTCPSRRCGRLYYCQTHASMKWRSQRAPAPSHSAGTLPPTGMNRFSKARIGKVFVDRMSLDDLLRAVSEWLGSEASMTIFYANSHAVTLAESNPEFATAMAKADAIFCDGFGIYLASRLLGVSVPERFSWPDWFDRLGTVCRDAGAAMFFLGAKEGVAAEAGRRLERVNPGLRVHSHHGHFPKDDASSAAAIDMINRSGARS